MKNSQTKSKEKVFPKIQRAILFALILVMINQLPGQLSAQVRLGTDRLSSEYRFLVEGKRVGLVTNPSGVNREGVPTWQWLARDPDIQLVALFGPEHGLDGQAKAGGYVPSYLHPELGITVWSLYGPTRKPTAEMLQEIELLIFDLQDIGARWYTYISTLYLCLEAAAQNQIPVVVLDRPNPLGGIIVEGPVLEERFRSFVGIDTLPMAHGMTIGELALFFNRKLGAELIIVPMEGYSRNMIFQDTGLPWIATSPMIPDIEAVFGYMATGLGDGTGIVQQDCFRFIGGKGIDPYQLADLLNSAGLPGVVFLPEKRGNLGGVRLDILDYYTFNPARTGVYALTYAYQLTKFPIPQGKEEPTMFEKIMGTDRFAEWWAAGLTPQEIEQAYAEELSHFRQEREKYLLYP